MGTDTEYILQSQLLIILNTRLVEHVLQPQSAEFTVGPVCHDAVTFRIILCGHQGRIDERVTRVVGRQPVITYAKTPAWEWLENCLQIPALLVGIIRQYILIG